MTFWQWVKRNLLFYARTHLAVCLAVAVATAVLTGALVVGDSVQETLRYAQAMRLGQTTWAVTASERFLSEEMGTRLEQSLGVPVAPVLQMRGIVARGDGSVRANQVQILGVDERFFALSPSEDGDLPAGWGEEGVLLNSALGERLEILDWQGVEVVLRIDKPGALSRDLVMSPVADSTVGARLAVSGRADDAHFGRFSLAANQQAPLSVLVPLAWLQARLDRATQVNLFLVAGSTVEEETLTQALKGAWRLADAEAELKTMAGGSGVELRSRRVFLDVTLGQAAQQVHPAAIPLLTYFVNELRVGGRAAPYSMVTAVPRAGDFVDVLPENMTDDQIVINQWLAEDLQAEVGDELVLTYYVPSGAVSLQEASGVFRICGIVPIKGMAADPHLMPDFPGLQDAENCSDWDPGLPLDLDRIRDQDEAYWDDHRGTPKAFVTLAAGRALWANRYGDLTAVRFPISPQSRDTLATSLRSQVDPLSLGVVPMPVQYLGDRARTQGTDFGQLFLGLSMFLIGAAVVLTALLFVFGIQSRATQTGLLRALGFPDQRIRRLYLAEYVVVALVGTLLGTVLGLQYTRWLIQGLSQVWQGAVSGTAIRFSASFSSLSTGAVSGFCVALMALVWTLRRQLAQTAHGLLSGTETKGVTRSGWRRWMGRAVPSLSLVGALLLLVLSRNVSSTAVAGAFFGVGALLLIAALTGLSRLLGWWGRQRPQSLNSGFTLALRQSTRCSGRSVAVVAMLASAVFMVVAVGANRKDPTQGAERRESGTGGFTLYAETAVPLLLDLNTDKGQKNLGLEGLPAGTAFVPLRVRGGDDASCLNLNRAQQPRLLGVSPVALDERGAFSFQATLDNAPAQWDLLERDLGAGVIPVIGDYPTVYWGLGKNVGDELVTQDHTGQTLHLRVVALLSGSMLQGSLLMSETNFQFYFPAVEGYRALLIDTPMDERESVASQLSQRLTDYGLSVEKSTHRLETFAKVENTYLSIFLVLGALGLILGCVGLGLIVVRNLLERQGELAMLRALGFSRRRLLLLVCWEHVSLLGAGLLIGTVCAWVAVWPALRAAPERLPLENTLIWLILIALSGVLWVALAARWVLRGTILEPLRKE